MEYPKMQKRLFTKLLLGTLDPLEEQELQKEMNGDPKKSEDFQMMKKIWEEAQHVKIFEQIDIESDWSAIEDSLQKFPVNYKRIPWGIYFLRVAALLILTAGLSAGFYKLLIAPRQQSETSDFTSYLADQGKKDIILPDGTSVSLNKGSDLTYRAGYAFDSRDVILNGEAFFNVIPDKNLPFRVFSGESVIEVTGTSFSVYQIDGEIHVAVLTGKVMLSSAEHKEHKISITANQSAYLSENNEIRVEPGIPVNVLSWKTGHLIFDQTPIDSALIDIARHFNRELSLEAGSIDRITAEFQDQPLYEILDELSLVAGLRFDTTGTALIVRK